MKKFFFTLGPVLEHRQRIEDEKQLVVAARQRELQAAQAELARLNGEFKKYSLQVRSEHKRLNGEELRLHWAHLEYLDRAMTMQHSVITQRRLEVERARADLIAASKDRKVIEKLKERRLVEHRSAVALSEQNELDDTNNRRYARSSR